MKMKENMHMLLCNIWMLPIIHINAMSRHNRVALKVENALGSKLYHMQSLNNHHLWSAPLCRSVAAESCVHTVLYNSL